MKLNIYNVDRAWHIVKFIICFMLISNLSIIYKETNFKMPSPNYFQIWNQQEIPVIFATDCAKEAVPSQFGRYYFSEKGITQSKGFPFKTTIYQIHSSYKRYNCIDNIKNNQLYLLKLGTNTLIFIGLISIVFVLYYKRQSLKYYLN